ncbi:MAG: filamentous hemagglutinin N-terminal domain-containing protein, partial [Cyanobacteria bacterium P01_A01_bin.135]
MGVLLNRASKTTLTSSRVPFGLVFGLATVISSPLNPAYGQIVPDSTISNSSVVNSGCTQCIINGGTVRGPNLFHSFREFSIPTGGEAIFNNSSQVENIFSRVTGNSISNIDGLIQSNSTANLFLINPNGIVFGPESRLDIGGSFVATSADQIEFGNRGFFSASDPEDPSPLLTIEPSALRMSQVQSGQIRVQSSADDVGLRVPDGESLILLGRDITVDGGQLQALAGSVTIGAVAESGTVSFSLTDDITIPDQVGRGRILFTNGAFVDVASNDGGDIHLIARSIDILSSNFRAGIREGLGAVDSRSGDIRLEATEQINVSDESIIFNGISPDAVGSGGNIVITTKELQATKGVLLSVSTFGQGDTGDIVIEASDRMLFEGQASPFQLSGIGSLVRPGAVGNAGTVRISTAILEVRDGGLIAASSRGVGSSGNIFIEASDRALFSGFAASARSRIEEEGIYLGSRGRGNIQITAGELLILNGAQITTSTFGQGNAGDVVLNVQEHLLVTGSTVDLEGQAVNSGVFSRVGSGAIGDGGNVTINTRDLTVLDAAIVLADTLGQGNAGNVVIEARDRVVFSDNRSSGELLTLVSTGVSEGAVGSGGDIRITANSLLLNGGARLSAGTDGGGVAGNVDLRVVDAVTISGFSPLTGLSSSITSFSDDSAGGRGGRINVNTRSLRVLNGGILNASTTGNFPGGDIRVDANVVEIQSGGQISTAAFASGRAGSIRLFIDDQVSINGIGSSIRQRRRAFGQDALAVTTVFDGVAPSGVFASTDASSSGSGGSIRIANPQTLTVSNGARISVDSLGNGDSGNVRIQATEIALSDGVISAISDGEGTGGNISLTPDLLTLGNQSLISTETSSNDGGNISIGSNQLLSLRRNSLISTEAGKAEGAGNGGDVSISSDFLVALANENSDIVANAFTGRGGNIAITAQGILGIEPQETNTPQSDITASSRFGVDGV